MTNTNNVRKNIDFAACGFQYMLVGSQFEAGFTI